MFEFSKVMQNFCGSTVSQQFTKHRALEAPQHLEPLVATRCWDCAIALYLYMRLSQYSNDDSDGSFLFISTHLLAQIRVCPFLALHSYFKVMLLLAGSSISHRKPHLRHLQLHVEKLQGAPAGNQVTLPPQHQENTSNNTSTSVRQVVVG